MYSYRQFVPGGRRDTSRIIKYVAEYNKYKTEDDINSCYCHPGKYDKNTPIREASSDNFSSAKRIAQIIKTRKGGKSSYGNFYLGKQLNINYLGMIEGMPGGSGMPPKNRFN
jgi:hypothetical protein